MNEEKQQWYYSQMGYESKDGFVTEDSIYWQYPADWEEDIIEGEFEQHWRMKYHWKRRGFSWKFEAIDHPPVEWLEEEIAKNVVQRARLKKEIEEYHKLIENIENK